MLIQRHRDSEVFGSTVSILQHILLCVQNSGSGESQPPSRLRYSFRSRTRLRPVLCSGQRQPSQDVLAESPEPTSFRTGQMVGEEREYLLPGTGESLLVGSGCSSGRGRRHEVDRNGRTYPMGNARLWRLWVKPRYFNDLLGKLIWTG